MEGEDGTRQEASRRPREEKSGVGRDCRHVDALAGDHSGGMASCEHSRRTGGELFTRLNDFDSSLTR